MDNTDIQGRLRDALRKGVRIEDIVARSRVSLTTLRRVLAGSTHLTEPNAVNLSQALDDLTVSPEPKNMALAPSPKDVVIRALADAERIILRGISIDRIKVGELVIEPRKR